MISKYKKLQNGSDIRGVALDGIAGEGVNLDKKAAADIAFGFAKFLGKNLGKEFSELSVAIGRDPRLSGEALASAFAASLTSLGLKVMDAGLASTPAMFMSTIFDNYKADGAVMITASHLPFNRNGFKLFTQNGGLDKRGIAYILEEAASSTIGDVSLIPDLYRQIPLMDDYAAHLRAIITKALNSDKPLEGLKITVDAGNGSGGFFATRVLGPLGADISTSQFLEPDGTFPNHQPNPENEEAMNSLRAAVLLHKPDLGLIFDTDVDRSSAVDEKGRAISRNGIVAMAAALIAKEYPGTTVVTDSITGPQLTDFLEKGLGLKHLRFKRGYKNVISKSEELNKAGIDSQLAIETSGHAAYKENFFLDDGAYLATKIVIKAAELKKQNFGISTVIESLAEPIEAREFRFPILAEDFAAYGDRVLTELEAFAETQENCSVVKPNYEGVRLDFGHGWLLLRKSLHDPIMPLNVESDVNNGVEEIIQVVSSFLEKHDLLDISALSK